MTKLSDEHSFLRRPGSSLLIIAVIVLAGFVYIFKVPGHPPGFYIDESSISYNAHLISQTGHDEYGQAWPLYFRAFGDYKNPIYIYLLAALFGVTGPSIAVARAFSATLGVLGGLLLGLLGWRMTRRLSVGLIVAISAWLTPWLFESSRLVFEVSIYPLLLALFLLALWRVAEKVEWNVIDILGLAFTLALLTYSYSIGRLLAPLLAAGLGFFITRRRWRSVVKAWLAYTITLLPLFIFNLRHPGALSGRFNMLTYIKPSSGYAEIISVFVRHFAANLDPWRWFATGENNVRDHVAGYGSLLVVTTLLGVFGLILVLRNHRKEAWWRFIVYALIVSVVPASLTSNEFPQLRLIAFPVFFHVLLVPSIRWLVETKERSERAYIIKRAAVAAIVVLIVAQGVFFQRAFHKTAPELWYIFDARFPRKVLAVARGTGKRPIYLVDPAGKSGYIQAFWYATLEGINTGDFIRAANGPVPAGAVVISTEEECSNCTLIAKSINYKVYAAAPNDVMMSVRVLPPEALRAQITPENLPMSLKTGSSTETNVQVKNLGDATWPAVGELDGRHAVKLYGRWLKPDGTLMTEPNCSSRFPYDLEPGDTAGVTLEITAPKIPGMYILELDVVQEQVAWFEPKRSHTFRHSLNVEP